MRKLTSLLLALMLLFTFGLAEEEEEELSLEDILSGGIYGSATKSRQHSSNITLNAVAAEQGNRKAGNPLLVSLFPPKSDMCGRYPWLKKDPWLLPLAWADRILRYRRETGSGDTAEPLKIGNTRIELLREYGIIR